MAAATGQKTAAGEGMGHNDLRAVGGEPDSGGFRATGFGVVADGPPFVAPPTLGRRKDTKVQETDAGHDTLPNAHEELDPDAEADYASWRPLPRAVTLQEQFHDLSNEDTVDSADEVASGAAPTELGNPPETVTTGPTSSTDDRWPRPVPTCSDPLPDSDASDALGSDLDSKFDVLGFRKVFKPTLSRPLGKSVLGLAKDLGKVGEVGSLISNS